MILESLGNSKETRHFIESIVDNYVIAKQSMIDNSNPDIIDVGVRFDVLFMTNINEPDSCSVSMHKVDNDSIEVCYLIKKALYESLSQEDSDNDIEHFIKIKRTEVIDKIILLKWLKDAGYIFLIDENTENLFDRDKLSEKAKENWDRVRLIPFEEIIHSKELFDIVSHYYNCRIIPSPQLIDFRNNNFKTPEQRRFTKSQCASWVAIGVAILIALFMAKCSKTTIDESQYETIINTIIGNNIKSNINEQVENAEYGCDQRECGKDSCVVSSVRY